MAQPQLSPPTSQNAVVLSAPNLALVFWGEFWANHSDFTQAGTLFFLQFLRGQNVDRLAQYGIDIGRVCGVFNVTQPWIPKTNLDGSPGIDIANSLGKAIQSGWLPQPTAYPNLVYVFLPDPTGPGAATPPSQGLGAQHWVSTYVPGYAQSGFQWASISFLFLFSDLPQDLAVLATAPGTGGDAWWTKASGYTALLSHEMYETFTDPGEGSGWTDANFPPGGSSECCDICDDLLNSTFVNVVRYGRWSLDYYWSNQDNLCVLGFENNWLSLGSPPGGFNNIAVGQNKNGAWEIFANVLNGDLWSYTGSTGGQPNGTWTGGVWAPLVKGAAIRNDMTPVVAHDESLGLMEVFAVNQSGQLWHVYQTAPGGSWTAGEILGAPPSGTILTNVAVGQNAPNPSENGFPALEAFVVGSDKQLHHIWQLVTGGWSGWGNSLGSPPPGTAPQLSGPCVVSNADGRLEVFLLGDDMSIWHIWQTAPNSGWSEWRSLPTGNGVAVRPLPGGWQCGRNSDGRIEIFVVAADQNDSWNVYHIGQTAPNNGWGNWASLMPFLPRTLAFQGFPGVINNQTDFQELQVCTIANDGALWTINQAAPPGQGWNQWRFLSSPANFPQYPIQSPVIAVTNNGLTVFIQGDDGNVWSISQINTGGPWGQLITPGG